MNDIKSFLRHDFIFHSVFLKLANNQVLEKIRKELGRGICLRIVFLYYKSPSGLHVSNKMHKDEDFEWVYEERFELAYRMTRAGEPETVTGLNKKGEQRCVFLLSIRYFPSPTKVTI
jgi:DNA-binding GntR family transcriptional regulator